MRLKSAVASDLPSCRHQHQHPQSEVTVWSQTCVAPPTCPTAGGPRQTIPFSSGRWPTRVPYGRGSSRNSRRQCCTKSNVLRGIQTRVAQWRHQTWQLQSCKPEQTYRFEIVLNGLKKQKWNDSLAWLLWVSISFDVLAHPEASQNTRGVA